MKDDLWDLNWYDVLNPCTPTDTDVQAQSRGSTHAEWKEQNNGLDRGLGQDEDEASTGINGVLGAANEAVEASGEGATNGNRRWRRPVAELERRFYWPFTARRAAPPLQPQEQQELDRHQEALEAGRRGGQRLWGPWLRHAAPCMDRRFVRDEMFCRGLGWGL